MLFTGVWALLVGWLYLNRDRGVGGLDGKWLSAAFLVQWSIYFCRVTRALLLAIPSSEEARERGNR